VAAAVEEEAVAEAAAVEAAYMRAAEGCMPASAVQEPDPCDPTPASPAKKDIPDPNVQAAAAVEVAEADPEELYS
jgi:hypothetical protein